MMSIHNTIGYIWYQSAIFYTESGLL